MIGRSRIRTFIFLSTILLFSSIFLDDIIADSLYYPIIPIALLSHSFLLAILAIAVLCLAYKKRGRRALVLNSLLIGSILLATQLLKIMFERIRPTDYTFDFSFPSGHSSFTFALIPMAFAHSRKAGLTIMVFALMIAISRVLLKEHYLSDVIAGGIMGYSISWVYIKIIGRDEQK